MMKRGEILDVDEIVNILGIDLLGIVPDDEQVIKSANVGEPIVINPDTKAAIAYRNIARRILGDSVPLMKLEEEKGVLSRVKRLLGIRS
ncbi:septum site-determining protein [Caldalkalibacillus thermarum TA2.A1]|nr:septum site-determining protein [Caldalkalibacillus thermarum TA2.A1]